MPRLLDASKTELPLLVLELPADRFDLHQLPWEWLNNGQQFSHQGRLLLVRQFARGVPTELLDAARVDGAPEWRILWTIGVPLLRPAIATLAMFAFVYYWNSYLWPLVILTSEGNKTMVLVVTQLVSYTTAVKYANVVFAGTLLAILPNIVLFLLVVLVGVFQAIFGLLGLWRLVRFIS